MCYNKAVRGITKMKKRYTLIWDTDSFCDGREYDDIEAAKADGLDTLIGWACDQCYDYPADISKWSEKQIEDWDYMVYNCSVYIIDNFEEEKYNEVWYPSDKECKEIGWLLYEELNEDR